MQSYVPQAKDSLNSIVARDLGKCYQIYANPSDRLKQAIWGGRRTYHRKFWALRNVSLEVKRGETVAIIGRNGSGKSTLLQIICGTLSPTEGSVKTSGTIAALLELGSGFNPEFTGIENVYLNASLLGLTQQQTKERLDDIQAFADIGDFVHQPVKTYSSGMLVRLAFAVIAHVEPSVLIVDEALSVGDAVFGQRCMRFIRRFTETGTLLFVSHDLNAVSSLCSRAIWIESGQVKMDTTTAPILTSYTRYCLEASNAEIEKASKAQSNPSLDHPLNGKSKRPSQSQGADTNDLGANPNEKQGEQLPSVVDREEVGTEIVDWNSECDYGNRRAYISEVVLKTMGGQVTNTPCCGEMIQVEITAKCNIQVESFLAGFVVRDRTGQIVFGENTTSHEMIRANSKQTVSVVFKFVMPYLYPGSYSLSAAVSEGDATQFQVMHYKPDVLILEPMVGNRQVHGVFATTKMEIKSRVHPEQN
ncbi:ABC transporter ATP-binding protein [Synechococcus sp. CS-1327]|uniref:ABC transporter ATP-binding protein n=1 Tax=Synechococcus sp. CS-1327 TaxID=2847977 RepID=UPI00223AE4DE|nr:ABC transporter ATP-binding protein [Synechococcus sp. CS-1327]MCT0233944.1 ABC transporter ATP-binding protein [Synechococcus sp. CS-1327]